MDINRLYSVIVGYRKEIDRLEFLAASMHQDMGYLLEEIKTYQERCDDGYIGPDCVIDNDVDGDVLSKPKGTNR